jgi:hypothetical protein
VEHAGALFAAYQQAEDTRSWTWLLREPDATMLSILSGLPAYVSYLTRFISPSSITKRSRRWALWP